MLHPVCPQVRQPLHIDTDINYSLDMSKFPGLDDPCHVRQPALLIATPDTISNYFYHCGDTLPLGKVKDTDNASSVCSVHYSRNMGVKWDATSKFPDKNIGHHIDTSSGHILEDLLTAMDTYTNGLLERLITIQECAAPNSMMAPKRNTSDLCYSNLTHGPVLLRNNQQRGQIPHGYFHGARYVQTNTPVCRSGINGLRGISDCEPNLLSLSALRNNTSYKRKRTQDEFESDIRKRHCTGIDTLDAGRCYGYAGSYLRHHQLPTFTSIVT